MIFPLRENGAPNCKQGRKERDLYERYDEGRCDNVLRLDKEGYPKILRQPVCLVGLWRNERQIQNHGQPASPSKPVMLSPMTAFPLATSGDSGETLLDSLPFSIRSFLDDAVVVTLSSKHGETGDLRRAALQAHK